MVYMHLADISTFWTFHTCYITINEFIDQDSLYHQYMMHNALFLKGGQEKEISAVLWHIMCVFNVESMLSQKTKQVGVKTPLIRRRYDDL